MLLVVEGGDRSQNIDSWEDHRAVDKVRESVSHGTKHGIGRPFKFVGGGGKHDAGVSCAQQL